MRLRLHHAFLIFAICANLVGQEIRKFDFQKYLDRNYSRLCDDTPRQVGIGIIQYFDVDGDGVEEALVLASTCATGSAGPDIASVYKLLPSGKIRRIFVSNPPKEFKGKKIFPDRGNWTQDISFKDGSLILTKVDRYGLEGEIKFIYQWKQRWFELVDVIKVPPNP